ncbi:hypothetical protein [Aerosakkonema funiforme]|uniref:Uncharacterized protein n=2 Tax=Oscillatoriophycideae TaxID=1301283 RepID=A0A926V9X4_9CYAN|nr:hypothetical protein [Aerosakkonema funiforme]MBD2179897.1 hypothetical protein [Aerosakkonema funiforme FACHB-1375]
MFLPSWRKLNSSLVLSGVTLLCLLAIALLQVPHLNQLLSKSKNASEAELKKEVETERVRLNLIKNLPSLGFNNLIADWVMLNFLQYFGDDPARDRTGYELSSQYFDIIIDRDPRFFDSYVFLSTSVTLYAGKPEKSVALMEKGLKSLSPQLPGKYYYVWRYKGIDELLFLGKPKAAKRSFEMAAQWARLRSDPESQNVATLSERTASFLSKNPNSKLAQAGAWSMVLGNAVDDRVRKLAISRIEALGGKVNITPEGRVEVTLPKTD